ncbi:hypothetical protein CAI21_22045 [Alkalilimnicola ehrlichii]|uniref:YdbS-like PH domain-containing protein n=1 Tax=Alkalilimnicola ehrlichii TaxID=351052 RepID=A0A3E0WHB2_9GAMM|nr:PH domain-containing protein [Alkalilimnicola ehrlichii]RFA24335.1 hypothetical protein CAI21_22045 [Alkalilimnicola ehrlichii]RFA31561.1 hypothetical protein CAL65_22220 [Alkalilimnicola ehrlichii]
MTESAANNGLSCWHRLSPWAVLFLLLQGSLRFARDNLPLVLGAGAGVAFLEQIGPREVAIGGVFLALLAAVLSLRYYQRFRFRLDADVLVVQKGLFERTELKVGAERVQHMAIDEPVYMRPFDVVRFSVDTPGGKGTEVELPGIARNVAEALRERLGRQQVAAADATEASPAVATEEVVFRASARGLTLHGIASNYLFVYLAAAVPFLQVAERLGREHWQAVEGFLPLGWVVERPVMAATLAVSVLVSAVVLLSLTLVWWRFYGFTLVQYRDRFTQTSGLLNRQHQVLTLSKLQSVEWVQTPVGRLLRRGFLVCKQYGGVSEQEERAGGSFLVPALGLEAGRALSRRFWSALAPESALSTVHPYYRRAMAVRFGLAIAACAGLLALVTGAGAWWWLALAAPFVAMLFGHLRWRAVAWCYQGGFVQVRRGLLGRRTAMFPAANAQAVTITQSWFQRRRGLVSLHLSVASGPVSIPFIPAADGYRIANEVLYRVEKDEAIAGATGMPTDSKRA